MEGIKIKSFGAYVPEKIMKNSDFIDFIDTSDEWITSRTGIRERRISTSEDTSHIAIKAANIALERAKITGEDIDLLIVATVSPDNYCPSVACMVQKEIKADNAMAFDISAACTGFVFASELAYSMMLTNKKISKALIIGAETLSKVINWEDRSTCVLFGDGSGAMILSREEMERKKEFHFFNKSVGEKGDCLLIGAEEVNNPFVKDIEVKSKKISMNGQEVFKFATNAIVKALKSVLSESNISINEIDYIIPHQANFRIIEFAAKKLMINTDKFYVNLERYGNTSSASIPIAINEMYEKGLIKEGMKLAMVGFGGGLTYGASIIEI